jgi:putative transposase
VALEKRSPFTTVPGIMQSVMTRRQAYKFELRPNGEQERKIRRYAGSCRFIYNKALALQKALYETEKKKLSYADLCKKLPAWKREETTLWLQESPSQILQQVLKDLDRAYSNFFAKRADFPKFKKKGQRESFRFPDPKGFKVDGKNGRMFLPKLGWVRYRKSREVLGTPKNITVSQSNGKWFASIQTEREVEKPPHPSTSAVGIDVGVTRFATLSTGQVFAPLNSFRKYEKRLGRAQRVLSRKIKFSNNWRKARARVQKIHFGIGNSRRDYLHKTSTIISKNHAMIFLEELQIENMSRSGKGTVEEPGTNVRAKSGLNKSILDQGWGEFRRQLEYKQDWSGGRVVTVAPQHTSQQCSCCGHTAKENRVSQAAFTCVKCGHQENADLNAAQNILAAGHAVLACGDTLSFRAEAQEPIEAMAA